MRNYVISGAIALAAFGGITGTAFANDTANSSYAVPAAAAAAPETADKDRLEADVRFLADDSLEGREAGTPAYAMAAGYVAGQFAAIGIQQGGDNGTYFQNVPLIAGKSTGEKDSKLTLSGNDLPSDLKFGDDFVSYGKIGTSGEIEGELVFVGYGFAADGYEQDDFAGVDVEGKIAVVLRGAPTGLNSEERAHFRSTMNERLSARGAIGRVMLFTPNAAEQFPFSVVKRFVSGSTSMNWADENGNVFSSSPNVQATAILSPELSEKLFEGQPVSWDDISKFEDDELDSIASFDMGITAKVSYGGTSELVASHNVVGIVPGTDPELAGEYVLVTAHLDHTGIDDDHGTYPEPKDGEEEAPELIDSLNNGAMDNATGTASMLEVARLFVDNPARRPIMFVALTAEEKGLVGSDFMARNPLPLGGKPVANINLDMPIVTYELKDVVAFGAERSTMIGPITEAVEAAGMKLSPDPVPEQGLFARSDQYSFVQQGVPSLFLVTGHGGDGAAAQADFLENHYHKPSDEVGLIDFTQLKRFTDVNHDITRSVANMDERPVWLKGDFFGRAFGGEMQD